LVLSKLFFVKEELVTIFYVKVMICWSKAVAALILILTIFVTYLMSTKILRHAFDAYHINQIFS